MFSFHKYSLSPCEFCELQKNPVKLKKKKKKKAGKMFLFIPPKYGFKLKSLANSDKIQLNRILLE